MNDGLLDHSAPPKEPVPAKAVGDGIPDFLDRRRATAEPSLVDFVGDDQ
jgi:hypothetical protein